MQKLGDAPHLRVKRRLAHYILFAAIPTARQPRGPPPPDRGGVTHRYGEGRPLLPLSALAPFGVRVKLASALLVFLRYPALARRSLRSFLSLRGFAPRTRSLLFCRCALLLCPDAVHLCFFPVFARLASPLLQPSLPQPGHGENKQDEHDEGGDDDRYDGAGTQLVLLSAEVSA
jgi:hypothetical protein